MREHRVVALDRHDGLPGRDLVALVQRPHIERVPVLAAELEDSDGLVDPTEHRGLLLEDLHGHVRMAALLLQELLREVEVGVGVVALPDPVGREPEDLWIEPSPGLGLGCHGDNGTGGPGGADHPEARVVIRRSPRSRRAVWGAAQSRSGLAGLGAGSTRRISPSAAVPTSSCSGVGSRVPITRWISLPGLRRSRVSRESGWRSPHAKTSTATAALPRPTATSAAGPRRPARRAATLPSAAVASIGATRWDPQRSCSFPASAASESSS